MAKTTVKPKTDETPKAESPLTPHGEATAFLNSKGIDPPIKSMPLHNISFDQLVEWLEEYKEARMRSETWQG